MDVYVQASSGPFSIKIVTPEVIRRSANYHPSVWGDHFLTYASDLTKIKSTKEEELIQELKEEVKKMLVGLADMPSQQLKLIDDIQRLGVSFHFESEIDAALQHIYDSNNYLDHKDEHQDELHNVALRFRLLRQQGHKISSKNAFRKFLDEEGKFKETLINDERGMLSLYEAAHLRVHGEDILDQALAFTTTHLESMINPQVVHALKQPIRMGLTRVEARHYISIYQQDDLHNKELLKFAKLDYNLLQKAHQRELGDVTKWWKDLNVAKNLPFARDRIVECYFWILGLYFEPQYFLARKIMTKVISLTSIIDDIYDVYGTFEELLLFTDAIDRFGYEVNHNLKNPQSELINLLKLLQRWDITAIDQLPKYMRLCYKVLLDVYTEMEEELAKEERYCVYYAKAAMKQLVRAYMNEAKWFHEGYVPTMEEYMEVALVSCGYIMLATTSFVGMGDLVTKEAFDWVSNDPLIVRASSVINRLMDDMVGHEFEQERGHVASAVECYMKQHGASKKEVFVEFNKQVTNAWKDINQECHCSTAVPMPLLMRVLNLARVINLLYKEEDGYINSKTKLKDLITSHLIDSVPL